MTTGMTGPASGYGSGSTGSTGGSGTGSTTGAAAGTAKEQAGQVAGTAKEQAAGVAQTGKEEAKHVAQEAATQARDLAGELKSQAQAQAGQQRERLVSTLQTFGDDLEKMARGEGGGDGMAAEVARQLAQRAKGLTSYVESKEPGDLLQEVQDLARRKPGTFLLGAAALGVLAGRFTRGAVAAKGSDGGMTAGGMGGQTSTRTPEPLTTDVVDPAGGYPSTSATIPPSAADPSPVAGTTPTSSWGETTRTTATGTTGGAGGIDITGDPARTATGPRTTTSTQEEDPRW